MLTRSDQPDRFASSFLLPKHVLQQAGMELGPGCTFHLREWRIDECKEATSAMSEERKFAFVITAGMSD